MNNILIVEAANDATFIKAMVRYLNTRNNSLINIHDYVTLDYQDEDKKYRGLSEFTLTKVLERLRQRLQKEPIKKIGIILDQDQHSLEDRLKLINDCIQSVFTEAHSLTHINEFKQLTMIEQDIISIAAYFINVDGQGELETLLRTIKHHDSSIADCLEQSLIHCLQDYPKDINTKNLDKKWVDHYLRYDTCKKKEKGDANNKCSFNEKGFNYVMEHKTEIWNFEHPSLQALKDFLQLFNN